MLFDVTVEKWWGGDEKWDLVRVGGNNKKIRKKGRRRGIWGRMKQFKC